MEKVPPRKRSLRQNPLTGTVTVSVVRKHSVRPYETLDVQISVTAEAEPEESQSDAVERVYSRLKPDVIKISNEMLQLAKEREL